MSNKNANKYSDISFFTYQTGQDLKKENNNE